jgi:hypothetical protein
MTAIEKDRYHEINTTAVTCAGAGMGTVQSQPSMPELLLAGYDDLG